jgi:hypothetical protein
MAVTKIIPIRFTIQKSVDYICNPAKTDGNLLIHAEHCFQQTAGLTFQHHLAQTRAGGNTIGRHLIQSFAPGEVDPDTAHEIGKKLAAEILGGEYAFVMATHIDCGHVHNHFVWGAANIKTYNRYRSNKGTYHEIRKISDRLCKENELSVIVPKGIGKSYAEYQAERAGRSWKGKLKNFIDATISESSDFEDFIMRMKSQGYAIKRGKHIAFQAPEQTRFTRAKSLGAEYAEDVIKERIAKNKNVVTTSEKTVTTPPIAAPKKLIDIEGNEKIKSSPGYTQWARIHNLKVMAEALIFVQENGGVEAFDEYFKEVIRDKHTLGQAINAVKERVKNLTEQKNELTALRANIKIYRRTKDIHRQYREMKKSKNNITFFGKNRAEAFRKENQIDITAYENAKEFLDKFPRLFPNDASIENSMQWMFA